MFGLILTKLRSRLRNDKMTENATLRMQLRDKHEKEGLLKDRLKRKTTSHKPIQHSTAATTNTNPTESGPSTLLPQSTAAEASNDGDMEDFLLQEGLLTADGEIAARSSRQRFSTIVEGLTRDADAASSEEDMPRALPPGSVKISLKNLFDLDNDYWQKVTTAATSRTLQEEMELHQLLDLDAEGDPDDVDEDNDVLSASI